MFFTQRCTTHEPWCLLLARRVKKEWKQAQGGDGCAVSTGLYSLFPHTKSCGGQEGNSDPLQWVSKGDKLPNEKPDLPMCGRSLHSPDILKYCPFSSAGGNCSPWPWAVFTQPTGYKATDTCHLHLSWPLSQFCHMHKPRLSKEYQDGKVTKSGQPWQPRQTSFQSHFLNTHIEQTRTGPFQIAHTSTLCYRGTLLPFIRKLMTGNIQLN